MNVPVSFGGQKKSRLCFLVVLSVRVTTLFKWKFPTKSMDSYPTIREWPWPEVVSPTAQWAQHLPGRWHCPAATRNCASTKHWQRSPRIVRTLGSWVQTRGANRLSSLPPLSVLMKHLYTCLHEQVPVVCWIRSLGIPLSFSETNSQLCGHYLTQRAPNNARLLVRKKSDPASYWGKRSILKSFCCQSKLGGCFWSTVCYSKTNAVGSSITQKNLDLLDMSFFSAFW